MKVGIISDIHANLEALNEVLKELRSRKVDFTICLGDIVGYGPDPNEVVEICKREVDICVLGNHDYAILYPEKSLKHFNVIARSSILWTASVLEEENKRFLRSLPLKDTFRDMEIVHSNPGFPMDWAYIFSLEDAVFYFQFVERWITFIGHTHIPALFSKHFSQYEYVVPQPFKKIHLDRERYYMINPGSVGQPRDGDSRASFMVLDMKDWSIELVRVSYDIQKVKEKILESELPPILAYRLEGSL